MKNSIQKILETLSTKKDSVFVKKGNKIIFCFSVNITKYNSSIYCVIFKNELEQFSRNDIEEYKVYNTKSFIKLGILEEANCSDDLFVFLYSKIKTEEFNILVANLKKDTLKEIENFIGKDEVRYYLNGMFFDSEQNNIVATSGHVLYCDKIDFFNKKSFISRFPLFKDDCKVYVNEKLNVARFEYELFDLYSYIIQGEFPDYKIVIPEKKYCIKFDFVEVEKYLDKNFDKIIFEIDKTYLTKNQKNKKEIKKEIDLQCMLNNKEILDEICGFNIKYLQDCFSCIKTREGFSKDNCCFMFNENNKTILLMGIKYE